MLLKDFMNIYQKTFGHLVVSLINNDYDETDLNSSYSSTIVCMEANPSDSIFLDAIDKLTTNLGNCKVERIDDVYTSTYIYIKKNKEI